MNLNEELKFEKKDYQALIYGKMSEGSDDAIFIRESAPSQELIDKGLGGSRFANLQLIEKFDSANNFDIGGSSKPEQHTLFESNSSEHFRLLNNIMNNPEAYIEEQELVQVTNSEGKKENVKVRKLKGLIRDVVIFPKKVNEYYVAQRTPDGFKLRFMDKYVGHELKTMPMTSNIISVVLIGSDATEDKLKIALEREYVRRNVNKFNVDSINEMAASAGTAITEEWFMEATKGLAATKKAVITEGEDTKQEPNVVPEPVVQATGTNDEKPTVVP